MSSSFQKAGGGLTKVGGLITGGITAPLLLAGKSALETAGNFQQGMAVLQATSGATAGDIQKLSDLSVQLGADLTLPSTSAVDAGQAMLELSKAGLSVNDVMTGTRGVLELAAAGELSNADAAEIAANALNAFGLSGSETAHVADLLAASANASSADVSDMAVAFKQAASVAAQLGVPIDDLTTALAEMANAGIKGSDAGTSVRTMLMRLAAPTDTAAGAMDDLGISAYDLNGNFKTIPELISTVNGALSGLSQEQKNAALQTIFGADAIRAANVVLLGGAEAYGTMETAVTKTGAAQDLAAAQTTGLKGAFGGLQSSLETVSLEAGQKLAPIFTSIAHGASDLLGWIVNLNPNILAFAAGFVGVIAVLGPLAAGLGLVITFANPVTITIAAIVAGLALLGAGAVLAARNWDTIVKAFPEAQVALDLVKASLEGFGRIAAAVLPGVGTLFIGLAKLATVNLRLIAGSLIDIGAAFDDLIHLRFGDVKDDLKDIGSNAVAAAKQAVSGFEDITSGVGQIASGIGDVISGQDLLDKATKASEQSTQKARTAANEYRESMHEAAASAAGMALAIDDSTAAMDRWDDVQANVDLNVSKAAETISSWQANLDETTTALGYLNDQVEAGIPLSVEQQKQYDTLTWAQARQTAGVEESHGAFVDAATAQAVFLKEQDDLRGALDSGQITLDQYNQGIDDARTAFNSSQGAAGEMANSQQVLADSIGAVVDKLRDLLVAMGVIPPDVTTNLNVNGEQFDSNIKTAGDDIVQFSSMTGTATLEADASDAQANTQAAAKAAVDFAATDYGATLTANNNDATNAVVMAKRAALDFAIAQYNATLTADNSDALSGINAVQSAIDNVQKSFTVYANLDYTAVTGGLATMEGYLPNSPAKYGPMSTLPDWSFLTWTLAPTFSAAVGTVQDGGAAMLQSLGSVLADGSDEVVHRFRDIGDRSGDEVRHGFRTRLGTRPTLGELILDAVTAGIDPTSADAGLAGTDIAEALVKGVAGGLDEFQAIFELMHGDALTALAEMQHDLEGKIRLGQIAGDDTSDLQAKLDAVNQIIATWAEQTGLDFNEEVASILAPDISDPITSAWLDLLGNLGDIISGKAAADLQGTLANLQNELTVALATDAPQAVIDSLNASITATQNQLAQVGAAYAAAVASGMADPTVWLDQLSNLDDIVSGAAQEQLQGTLQNLQNQLAVATSVGAPQAVIDALNAQIASTQAQLEQIGLLYQAALDAGMTDPAAWQETLDTTQSYLDDLVSGDAITNAKAEMDRLANELAVARATGASNDVINAINQQFVEAQAAFNQAATDASTLIASGLASPEAIAAYNEAMGIVTQIPVDQLLALAPQMQDGGLSLLTGLVAGVVDGSASYEDVWALINEMTGAATDNLDSTIGASNDQIVESLQELQQSLLDDLAQALEDGSDPSAIQANLAVVNQALADTQAQVDDTINVLDQLGMIAGPGSGFGSIGGHTGGGGSGGGGGSASGTVKELADSVDNIVSSMLGFQTSASILSNAIQQAADQQFGADVGEQGTLADELLSLEQLLQQQGAVQSPAVLAQLQGALAGQLGDLGLTGPEAIGQTILDGMGLSPDVLANLGFTPDAIAELQTSIGSDQHSVIGTLDEIHSSLERILDAILHPDTGAGAGAGPSAGGDAAAGGASGHGRTLGPETFGEVYHHLPIEQYLQQYTDSLWQRGDAALTQLAHASSAVMASVPAYQPMSAPELTTAPSGGAMAGASGGKFVINLDLGHTVKTVVVDALTDEMSTVA